ncbi:hypothetical protein OJF2_21180 [Aquisphaera giovannonii]|uniref:PEP-CTERM protein-sorting domain-containing protein n=1 Tax=Aquisphaera giovannonii TaxID=406548 RepID=A0A5B9W089_9BACT|nr:hypothetical protein [Aquisphaera giovannonii]QEH33614.1 hypothetical protein OJF2_21180 [Aquisphaera giovannonii]
MNKFTSALALGAGLVLSLTGPSAHASSTTGTVVQQLSSAEISASTFNSLFTPIANAAPIKSSFQFMNTTTTGTMESQVFKGKDGTSASGLYAYAYQIAVNNVSDVNGQPTSVNSASFAYNATPVPAALTAGATPSAVYVSKDGQIGGLDLSQAGTGSVIQTPTSVAWMPGSKTGALTLQYLDAAKGTGPLPAGSNSATVIVLSNQPFTTQPVSLQNANPQIAYPSAYSAQGGEISEVPVPEPAAVLAWAGMIGAAALVRRTRKARAAA